VSANSLYPEDSKLTILGPAHSCEERALPRSFQRCIKTGFTKVRIDGEMKDLYEGMQVDRYKVHTIELVIDRFPIKDQFFRAADKFCQHCSKKWAKES